MDVLLQGPYFLGSDISLVDITFAPMLERAAASLTYYKGYVMRGSGKWPELEAWFDAMESRPTYLGTKSDHYTHCHDLPPQLGGMRMRELIMGHFSLGVCQHAVPYQESARGNLSLLVIRNA